MNIYCQSCGQLHKYTSAKPNFCTNCGSGLSVGAANSSLPKHLMQSKSLDSEEEDVPETKQELATNLEKLTFDYQDFSRTNKLGNIAGTYLSEDGKRAKSDPLPKIKKITKKAFLEEFKREAGSLRSKRKDE